MVYGKSVKFTMKMRILHENIFRVAIMMLTLDQEMQTYLTLVLLMYTRWGLQERT